MTRHRLAIVLALAAAGSVFLAASPRADDKAPAPKLPAYDFSKDKAYKVVRVIDGDTVVLDIDGKETKVRLIGVDTPETVHPTKPVEAYGKEASRFTSNLLKGESVYLRYKPDEKADKYGRTLAYLFRAPDGLFVNLEIVRQGYGHAYTQYPFEHMELFRHYERAAREAKKGLWGEGAGAGVGKAEPPAKKAPKVLVYITATGQKYHRGGCRYLKASKIPISLEEAKKGYEPCSVCRPPQ